MIDWCSLEEEVGCELCHRGVAGVVKTLASVARLTSCSKDRGRLRLPRQTDTLMVLYHSACEEGATRNSSPVLELLSRLEQCSRVKDRTAVWEWSPKRQAYLRARRGEVNSDEGNSGNERKGIRLLWRLCYDCSALCHLLPTSQQGFEQGYLCA